MPDQRKIEKFAELAVNIGANVQKDQIVVVNASTDTNDLARKITEKAYDAGAKRVEVQWNDPYVSRFSYLGMSEEALTEVPEHIIKKYEYFVDQGACFISITSPVPGLNSDVPGNKIQKASQARSRKLDFFQTHMMGNRSQWTIVGAPNATWAEKVFPEKSGEEAVEALWDAILNASRVYADNDPVKDWEAHNEKLARHNKILNDHQFKALHFENSLGTDITVELVKNHVWAGGNEESTKGIVFNPNIPTEESFTMPLKTGVNGTVYATKPLNYQGNLIEDFWLTFKDGEVIDYDAKKEKDALKNLVEFDEGSRYLGEIALIPYDSPISNTGILFFNTLFDENASCHMALGRAYPMNVEGGTEMDKESLKALGYNHSMAHSDFMFGSEDLSVKGIKEDGTEIQIFKDGNFVI
ncbi:MAG: aminopeptidase [Bacillota bacterium]